MKFFATLICILHCVVCDAQQITNEQLAALKLQMDAHIGKEVPEELIDKIAGAKCSVGNGVLIPGAKNTYTNYGVSIFSNWQETSTSVAVLGEIIKKDGAARKDIMLDYIVYTKQDYESLKAQFPNSNISFKIEFLFGYPDEYIHAIGYFDTTDEKNNEHYTKAIKVWGVRKSDMKFVEISTEGIYAINEGAGV